MNGISRRNFMKTMAVAATAAAMALPNIAGAKAKTGKRPNIVMFITDDQDKYSIGAFGGDAYTPNLDRMAKEGMKFNHAYVSSTVCTPSRYSFLTGRYAGRSYSKMYHAACPPGKQGYPSFNVELEEDNMNVGNILRRNGYVTGYAGKFHVGPELKREEEYEKYGLKYIDREMPEGEAASEAFKYNERWYRQYLMDRGFSWAKNIYWGNLQNPYNHHNAEWTIDAALEFIEDNKDGPFYLHYCTTLVHGPDKSWRVSMDHPRVSGEGMLDELPDVMTDRKEILKQLKDRGLNAEEGHAGYTWTDDSIGAVLNKLDELGIADNTLVVFIADHGSKMKGTLFNVDGINVPCIMRWPDGIKANSECDELIQNIDFAATFFDLAGAKVPKDYILDGTSLKGLFGGGRPADWRDHLYFEMGSGRAICTKDYKYIALRYTQEQIDEIKTCPPEQLPQNMAYIGRLGIGVRGAVNPNFFEADQLYYTSSDAKELKNLADNPEYRRQLVSMRKMLTDDLKVFDRPFGEFVPGGNAANPGSIDRQIELIKRIKIQGKEVTLPDDLTGKKQLDPKQLKAQDRAKRRENNRNQDTNQTGR